LGSFPNSSSRPTQLATLTGPGSSSLGPLLALIHPSAWKESSRKSASRILYNPARMGAVEGLSPPPRHRRGHAPCNTVGYLFAPPRTVVTDNQLLRRHGEAPAPWGEGTPGLWWLSVTGRGLAPYPSFSPGPATPEVLLPSTPRDPPGKDVEGGEEAEQDHPGRRHQRQLLR
jgi:hypothetical protein